MLAERDTQLAEDYRRIEQAILFLEQKWQEQPDLQAVAAHVGLSEYHFQRLFSRWAGISPKRFLQFLTLAYAKQLLAEANNLLDVTYETGLSSPGRLHDLFVTYEAMTPGEFKRKGEGLTIRYGFHESPFGECLLAVTERGICSLTFIADGEHDAAVEALQAAWPLAELREDPTQTQPFMVQIFTADANPPRKPLPLYLSGTNFQIKVWQALLQIPPGSAVSYDTVAALIGQPGATRAIGTAISRNPVAYLIPCHRVIRKVGALGDYRWGAARKKAMLGWEAAQRYHTEQ